MSPRHRQIIQEFAAVWEDQVAVVAGHVFFPQPRITSHFSCKLSLTTCVLPPHSRAEAWTMLQGQTLGRSHPPGLTKNI